jgi:protein-disulfide isomerase
MTTGSPGSRPTRNERRDDARTKAKQHREDQLKKDKRNRIFLQGGIAVAVVAVIAVVAFSITSSVKPAGPGPANMASDGIVLGIGMQAQTTEALAAGADIVPTVATPGVIDIRIYQDYLCPYCKDFDLTNAEQIQRYVEEGAATVEVHPIALLTSRSSGSKYSLRATTAAACVANYSPDNFWAFNQELFLQQPAEGTTGLDNTAIKAIIAATGATNTAAINTCIDDRTFEKWAQDATDRALTGPLPGSQVANVQGTPTILVNGIQYTGSLTDPEVFNAFVTQVAAAAYATATPTPTPTP